MFESPLSPNQKLEKEDERISPEYTEIRCMCEKCDYNKLVLIVVSICESCLKGKHVNKIDKQFPA